MAIFRNLKPGEENKLTKIGMFGPWLKEYGILEIIDKIDGNVYEEDIKYYL